MKRTAGALVPDGGAVVSESMVATAPAGVDASQPGAEPLPMNLPMFRRVHTGSSKALVRRWRWLGFLGEAKEAGFVDLQVVRQEGIRASVPSECPNGLPCLPQVDVDRQVSGVCRTRWTKLLWAVGGVIAVGLNEPDADARTVVGALDAG